MAQKQKEKLQEETRRMKQEEEEAETKELQLDVIQLGCHALFAVVIAVPFERKREEVREEKEGQEE